MSDDVHVSGRTPGAGRSRRQRLAVVAIVLLAGAIAAGGVVYLLRPSGPPPLAPGAPAIPAPASAAP